MANFSIRKLDDQIYQNLKLQAVLHGVSMEEEARNIITRAVSAPDKLSHIFTENFGTLSGVDLDEYINQPKKPHDPINFDD